MVRTAQRTAAFLGLIAVVAGAQAPTRQSALKPLAFEVVSIRHDEAPVTGAPVFGPIGDGYRMVNLPLWMVFLTAYVPSAGEGSFFKPDQISGMPPWLMSDRYDVTAKVADADLAEWQKPESQPAMLRAMLQAMLADRCKLMVHRETKEASVHFLVVSKGGPKFKETDPSVVHEGMKLPFGGVVMAGKDGQMAYGISMATVATVVSAMLGEGETVVDKTGLTGRYDVLLPMRERMGPDSDPSSMAFTALESMGLKLESGKAPAETLVIDHMVRPSEN